MFDISEINKHIFRGGLITKIEAWSEKFINVCGEFPKEETEHSGCRFFRFGFTNPNPPQVLGKELAGAVIYSLEVSKREGEYSVRLLLNSKSVNFVCRSISLMVHYYKGMSYRNMYGTGEYSRMIERQKYVLDGKYLTGQEQYELPDGYTLETASYGDMEKFVCKAALVRCVLKRDGKTVYEYLSNYSHPREFTEFIQHSNGHKYFPFHVDLYGISFLELDTLKVFSYVPEGYQHNYDYLVGESFIITDLHYDITTDLIAFGGCFWAGTSDVMVMKLHNPLDFELRLKGIHDIIDPDWELYDDINFVEWRGDKLAITADGKPFEIEIEDIEKRFK